MDDEAQLQRLSVCRTRRALGDQISRVPAETRTAFRRLPGTTFAQRREKRLYVAIAGAAVRVRMADGILSEVPLDAADPRQGMLEILQWCSRSEQRRWEDEIEPSTVGAALGWPWGIVR